MLRNKFFVAIFLLALGGIFGSMWQSRYDANYYQQLIKAQKPAAQVSSSKASIMIDADELAPILLGSYDLKSGESLLDLTQAALSGKGLKFDSKDYGEAGVLVTQIGDKVNGTDNKYWQYWVNNEQVQTAANKYIIKPGDTILWAFKKSQ